MYYSLNEIARMVQTKRGELQKITIETDNAVSYLTSTMEELETLTQVITVIQTVAKQTQDTIVSYIDNMMNIILDSILTPNPYTFKTVFKEMRNKTEVEFFLDKNGVQLNPLDTVGGGVVDILAFGLRILIWSLTYPRSRPVLLLDEPFRFLSRDLQPLASVMLKKISERLNLQIIMVSHSEDLIEGADKIFQVTQENGLSTISER